MGRFTFTTHPVEMTEGKIYHTATDCFPDLHGTEWYRTRGFKELALLYGSVEQSYRKTAVLINRVRHQPEATPSRTLQQVSEDEGQQMAAAIEQKATKILRTAGFSEAGAPLPAATRYGPKAPYQLAAAAVAQATAASGADPTWAGEIATNPIPYEDPDRTTNITIDDVGASRSRRNSGRAPRLRGRRNRRRKRRAATPPPATYTTRSSLSKRGTPLTRSTARGRSPPCAY